MKILDLLLLTSLSSVLSASPLAFTINAAGLPAGNYLLDFQFINGDAAAGNNQAAVTAFSAANTTLGALSTFGTVSGTDLMSGITLIDGAITEVDLAFTSMAVGPTFSFMVNTSANYAAPGPGDAFTFAITDTSLNSTRSSGNGAEGEIDLTGGGAIANVFAADPAFGGFQPDASSTATPEIPTSGLYLFGLILMRNMCAEGLIRRRRK